LLPSPSIVDPPPSPSDASGAQQLAVPAYINPAAGAASWAQLGGSGSGSVGIIVANVDNGPGAAANGAWTGMIHGALATGGRVLGYVDTGYLGSPTFLDPNGLPTRSGSYGPQAWLAQIEADIAAWYRFYGSDLGGIFLDQSTSTCGPDTGSNQYAEEYEAIRDDLQSAHPGAITALNPGTVVPRCYADAADVLVTFEGSYASYAGTAGGRGPRYEPLRWKAAPDQIWHIVYGAASTEEMSHAMALSRRRKAGYVYVTDAGLPNPFGSLPPADYWSAEQAQLGG
jgi:hypothetical protein